MRIRLDGPEPAVWAGLDRLRQVLAITSVSRAYPNRGGSGCRVYVEVHPGPTSDRSATGGGEPG